MVPALLGDLRDALRYSTAIRRYAWVDIRVRFDRTTLGPLWTVVTSLAWVATVGMVMSELFGQSLADNLPYLTFGVLSWQYISNTMSEATGAFNGQKDFVRSYRLPLTFFVLRNVVRNAIVLLIFCSVSVLISLFYGLLAPSVLLHIFPVVITYVSLSVPLTVILACVGARFLDLAPALAIIMHMMMLVTPIFWRKEVLPAEHPILVYNPFVPIIDLYRDLFLFGVPSARSYALCFIFTFALGMVASAAYQLTRSRIRAWL